jgi:hypothetical protein
MTQAKFSDTFDFSLDAIKHWEGGRRTPEAPARTLLTVIDKNPAAVLPAPNLAAFADAVGFSERTTVHVSRHRKRKAVSWPCETKCLFFRQNKNHEVKDAFDHNERRLEW